MAVMSGLLDARALAAPLKISHQNKGVRARSPVLPRFVAVPPAARMVAVARDPCLRCDRDRGMNEMFSKGRFPEFPRQRHQVLVTFAKNLGKKMT
jgi:hypothetical protein